MTLSKLRCGLSTWDDV